MAVTLADAAQAYGSSKTEQNLTRLFMMLSPLLEEMPMRKISGRVYRYAEEVTLPSVGWRPVYGSWAESSGAVVQKSENLFILGGEVKIDPFIVETDDGADFENRAVQIKLKQQAISNEFDRAVLEGDDRTNPDNMVGLRRRLSGSQVIVQSTTGAALTLAALDQLIDAVPFPDDQKRLYMNRTLRRKVKTLVDAVGGSILISENRPTFGTQPMRYAGIPIRIMERSGDASTILDFDEDPGDAGLDTASVYCIAWGYDAVHGFWNGKKPLSYDENPPDASLNQYVLRWETYIRMPIRHPRAAARLRGILNA